MKTQKLPAPSLDECIAASGGTKALIAKDGALGEIPKLLESEYGSRRVFLIADENTMRAAGDGLERVLAEAGTGIAGRLVFPAEPRLHGEYPHVQAIKREIAECAGANAQSPVPVSVGAGTINDLVKQAASELALPYLCVPTAASVDGYTSFGAALLKDGFKQTLPCEAPRCVVADTGVLARAPAWLSSSGFADLAGKTTAGADWIIADTAADFGAKGADRIDPKAWAMVQHGLRGYLWQSINAARGDADAIGALFEALAVTGFAMQYARNSRPVSGAEHLFAHVWEMEDLSLNGTPVTHGHKVAMGTLAVTAFIEELFADPASPPPPPPAFRRPSREERMAEVGEAFAGSPALGGILETASQKLGDASVVAKTEEGFRDAWRELRGRVLERLMPYSELKETLAKAGCPVLPREAGLERGELLACTRRAQMIRCRYGSLDLAWDLGCFRTVLARMENSQKYFY